MLRRLLYREARFEFRKEEELRQLHRAFRAMLDAYPRAYYWIHRIGPETVLITDFMHSSMLRYRGLEVVLIEGAAISYFRLPGARAGGRGHVPEGDYRVRIESPTGAAFVVDVRKNAVSRLQLLQCRPSAGDAAERDYLALPRRVLEPSKFADEMTLAITGGIEWIYRNYQEAEQARREAIIDGLRTASWPAAVAGVCDDADACLWLLKNGSE